MKILATFLAVAFAISAQAQSAEWHQGKLLQIDKSLRTREHKGSSHEKTYWTMQIEDNHILYFAEGEGSLPHVTENAPIEWKLDKEKVYFKDENGKEHKINLQKKRAE
jgi:tRNA G37 N-methylase Trm5